MGKLINMVLLIVAINFAMFLWISPDVVPGGVLWTLITNPENWSSLSLISYIVDALALVGGLIMIFGSITGNDTLMFAGVSGVFLSFGVSLVKLYSELNGITNFQGTPIPMLITAPMLVIYLYVVLKFWRGSD